MPSTCRSIPPQSRIRCSYHWQYAVVVLGRSRGNVHVLRRNVDVPEQILVHEVVVALRIARRQPHVLVQIEGRDLGKIEPLFSVHANRVPDRTPRGCCRWPGRAPRWAWHAAVGRSRPPPPGLTARSRRESRFSWGSSPGSVASGAEPCSRGLAIGTSGRWDCHATGGKRTGRVIPLRSTHSAVFPASAMCRTA